MGDKLWDLLTGGFYIKRYVLKLLPSLGVAVFYAVQLASEGLGAAVSGFCAMFCLIYTLISLYGVALNASEIVYGYNRYILAVVGLFVGCFVVGALGVIVSMILPIHSTGDSAAALDAAVFPIAIFLILRDILRFIWFAARSKIRP